jgi:hypothetical protein
MNKEYVEGFMAKCAALGVDPEKLLKASGLKVRGTRNQPVAPPTPMPNAQAKKPVPTTTPLQQKWTGPGVANNQPGSAKYRNTGGWQFPSTAAGSQAKQHWMAQNKK